MGNNLEDIYIRIKLDTGDSQGQVLKLEDALTVLQKKLDTFKRPDGSYDKSDPEVQNLMKQIRPLETLIKQNRQWIVDIDKMLQNLSKATLKELRQGVKHLSQTMRDLTREGADVEEILTVQEQMGKVQNEMKRRNAESQPLVKNIHNLTKLTADELARSVKESGQFVQILPKGTAEMRQMLSMHMRFREQQTKINGEMTFGKASSLGRGKGKADMGQLVEAGRVLKQYRDELGEFMNASTFDKLENSIEGVTKRTLEMARSIARGDVKASYADMQIALKIVEERWKSLDPNVKKNQKAIHDLGLEYNNLKSLMSTWGSATMTKADAGQILAKSQALIQQGAKADAMAVRYYIEQLKLAQNAEGISVKNAQELYTAEKKLTELMRTVTTTPLRSLSDVLKDVAGAKTLGDMERLRGELQAVFKTISNPAQAQQARAALDDIEERIKNFGKVQPKQRKLSDIIGDLGGKQSLGQLEALKKELQEIMKGMTDGKSAQQATKILADIQERIDKFGQVPQKMRPFKDMLAQLGTPQTLGQLQGLKKEMEMLLQTLTDGKKAQDVTKALEEVEAKINSFGKSAPKFRPMKDMFADLAKPQTLEGLKELKAEMEALLATVKDGSKAQQLTANIDKAQQLIDNFGKKTITAREASKAYSDGQTLLAKGTSASADAIRRVIESMDQAAKMTGLSLEQEQQYIAMKRELSKLLQGETTVTMSATDAMLAYTNAEQLLAQGGKADAVAVRQMVETMKQAAMAKGLSVDDAARMSEMAKQLYDVLTKVQQPTQSMRSLSDVLKDVAGAKTLGDMERLRTELAAVFKTISDPAQAQLARTELEKLDTRIKEFGKVKLDLRAILGNPQNFSLNEIDAAIKQLEEDFKSLGVGKTWDAQRAAITQNIQILTEYRSRVTDLRKEQEAMSKTTAISLAQGGDGTLVQMKEALAVLEKFRNESIKLSDGAGIKLYTDYINDLKARIDEVEKTQKKMMDHTLAESIARGTISGTVAELKEAKQSLEAFKQTLATTDDTGLRQVNEDLKLIDQQLEKVDGQVKRLKDVAEAQRAVANLNNLITQAKADPSSVSAQAMRDAITTAKAVQNTQGVTVKLSREAAAAEAEATRVMQARNVVALDAVTIRSAEAEATRLLGLQDRANMGELQQVIETYKQMVEQENIDVKVKEERKKKLEELQKLEKGQYKLKASDVQNKYDALLDSDKNVRKDAMTSEINETIEALKRLKNQQGVTREETVKYDTMIKKLEASLRGEGKAARDAAEEQKLIDNTLKNLKTAPIQDLEKTAKLLEERMKSLQRKTKDYVNASKEYQKVQAQLKGVKAQMEGVTREANAQGTAFTKAISKLASYLGIFGGFYLIRQQLQNAFHANIQYDESLTNIRKTTGLTAESVKMLAENIKRIDTRTALQDMNDLAYSAGKLGVKGVSDIMGFVRSAEQVKIALGEQLGEGSEAIEQLLKITTLMGTKQQFGLEESILRVGSSVNYLTMNSQATAQPMVDFMKRIAGVATQAGITSSELTGLAGAVNALGQPVEMSATSISKMIVQISGHSQQVAKALRMTAKETEDFMYQISSGQMMDALLTVLRKTSEEGGLSHLSTIVKDLGSNGQRVIQTIATLASNYQTVEKMVRMSNKAFDEGTSVTNEYNLKQQNTAALWERLKNNFSKMFVSTNAVEYINKLLRSLQGLPFAIKDMAVTFKPLMDGLSGLIRIISEYPAAMSAFVQSMMMTSVLQKVVIWTSSMSAGFTTMRRVIAQTGSTAKGFFAFMKTASFGNILTAALTVLLSIVNHFKTAAEQTKRMMEESIEMLERVKGQSQETTTAINALISKLQQTNKGTKERQEILDEINSTYGEYLSYQVTDAMNNDAIAESLRQVNKELKLKALLEGKEEMNKEVRKSYQDKLSMDANDLLDYIQSRLVGGTESSRRAAASNIVSELLRTKSDGTYVAESYVGHYGDNKEFSGIVAGKQNYSIDSRQAQNNLNQLFEDLILKSNEENQSDVQIGDLGHMYHMVSDRIASYLNDVLKREDEIQKKGLAWDLDINNATREVQENVKKEFEDLLAPVKDVVTQNGSFAQTKVSEDVEAADKQYWIDRKNNELKESKDRVEEAKKVSDMLNRIDDYMRVVTAQGRQYVKYDENGKALPQVEANETQEYKELRALQWNAQQYLRVLNVGRIENPEDDKHGTVAGQKAQDEYQNIINKIKAYYQIQKDAAERLKLDGKFTPEEYENELKRISMQEHEKLRMARLRILGKVSLEEWKKILELMDEENRFGARGESAMKEIRESGDPKAIGDLYRKRESKADEEGKSAHSVLSGIWRSAEEDEAQIHKSQVELQNAILQAWTEQNPMAKLTEQFQQQFETLGILRFSDYVKRAFVELDEQTGQYVSRLEMKSEYAGMSISDIYGNAMESLRQLGYQAANININTDAGVKKFEEAMKSYPLLASRAADATQTDLQEIYYRAYEYAEQFDELVAKQVEKDRRLWERMYKQSPQSDFYKNQIQQVKELYSEIGRLQAFGYSSRAALAQDYAVKRTTLNSVTDKWQNNINAATNKRDAKQAFYNSATDEQKKEAAQELEQAEKELASISQMPDEVRSAIEAMTQSMSTLQDATNAWVEDMTQAFDKFMDGFIPFRSWYEDKGDMAHNVFGTKAERQKAFGEFMDDIKKAVRDEIKERTKLAMTKAMLERGTAKAAKKANKDVAADAEHKNAEILSGDQALATAQEQVNNTVANALIASSKRSKEAIEADNRDEAISGMWGNFGEAMTKAWAVGGPYLGPVLAALVSTAVGGIITMVMNMIGGSKKKTAAPTKAKLVSGMLTYDRGNVQSIPAYDNGIIDYDMDNDGTYVPRYLNKNKIPVMADDGRVYMVDRNAMMPSSGTGMVTRPTLTTIGGVPSLVGERGPEMVIGRETTAAMQMYRPDLLRQIQLFDRNRSNGFAKAYDSGNVQQTALADGASGEDLRALLAANQEMMAQLAAAQAALVDRLNRPINATINKNGAGGLVETVAEGFVEARQRGNIKNVSRLFGR